MGGRQLSLASDRLRPASKTGHQKHRAPHQSVPTMKENRNVCRQTRPLSDDFRENS